MSLLSIRHDLKDWMRKRRVLLILGTISALIGLVNLASPLDLALSSMRNKARAMPVSGQIAVVGVDDRSIAAVGPWPWSGARLEALTDTLFANGAKRVFFNMPLKTQDAAGDRQLAQTFARFPDKVFLAAQINARKQLGAERELMPAPELAAHTQTVSNLHFIKYWNGINDVPYRTELAGREVDSLESVLAGVNGRADEAFPIDYALQASSIPYVDAADILKPEAITPALINKLKGKDVVIGLNSQSLSPQMVILSQGRAADVFVSVLGAETLMRGKPLALGWWPMWLLACIASAYALSARPLRLKRVVGPVTIVAMLVLPLLLDSLGVRIDVMAGVSLMIMSTVVVLWRRFGARQKNSGTINPVSGLFTTNAIRHEDRLDPRPLVAARIRRFTEVVSALPPDSEQQLIKEIVGRLELGAGGSQLYHGDDGNFFWLPEDVPHDVLVEQFQALHVIFRNPVKVLNKAFDVDISFGLDQEFKTPLSHRMTSALAAAHTAEQEGTFWKLHDPAATEQKEWTLSLLGELDEALRVGRIWVSYQPKIDMVTKKLTGAEALVRWTHETRGPVSPSEFVAMAERHGRIDKLTAFVMDQALMVAKHVRLSEPDFTISVNISPSLLGTREVLDMIRAALERHELDPSCLILEVTETMAIVQSETPQMLMEEFRAMGIGLSIDDYGTGLSTLEYLRKIPATELKIDRRFIMDICTSQADQAVMKSTIQLAHALGMKAVAEGIETAESLYLIASMGCDLGQGYHIARPMDGDSLIGLIKSQGMRRKHG